MKPDILLDEFARALKRNIRQRREENIPTHNDIRVITIQSKDFAPYGKVWEAKNFVKGEREGNIEKIQEHLKMMESYNQLNLNLLKDFRSGKDMLLLLDDIRTSGATLEGIFQYLKNKNIIDHNDYYSLSVAQNYFKSGIKDTIENLLKNFIKRKILSKNLDVEYYIVDYFQSY